MIDRIKPYAYFFLTPLALLYVAGFVDLLTMLLRCALLVVVFVQCIAFLLGMYVGVVRHFGLLKDFDPSNLKALKSVPSYGWGEQLALWGLSE